ncbi:2-dehydro-3-deoxygalactonokinase [Niveispirillum sp. KHB5.9]|uniref:2-dehydro-3-deoxygalactonokinase n=1 Tax=Niveispirillum sp. KHB5.9 TaxID=3400269 RepID=UPI003A856ECE
MRAPVFIAGEWGSMSMRLFLCRQDGTGPMVLDTASGRGVRHCQDMEEEFFTHAAPWIGRHGPLPVILAGMIGSEMGWRSCAYAPCPAGAADLSRHLTRFTARGLEIAIAPGLRCTNIFGQPDVMRGEEMQLFGWLGRQRRLADERHLICLTGPHPKWAATCGDRVESFFTSMQGELFDLLLGHSLLGRGMALGPDRQEVTDMAAFRDGVALLAGDASLSQGHAMFAARSRLVTGGLSAESASSFLAGIMVGGDARDAVNAHRARGLLEGPVVLAGAERHCRLYAEALGMLEVPVAIVAGYETALRGMGDCLAGTGQ